MRKTDREKNIDREREIGDGETERDGKEKKKERD